MSKTVDDLVKVFKDGARAEFGNDTHEMYRAGIAAVIRALAPDDDEIAAYNRLSYKVQEQLKCECEYLPEDRCIRCSVVDALKCLETRYYEILGDAGEKVAGRVGETKHPDVTSPATAPAPAERSDATAVCEWTQTAVAYWRAGCHASAGPMYAIESETCVQKCTLCQRPIKFTEAKP